MNNRQSYRTLSRFSSSLLLFSLSLMTLLIGLQAGSAVAKPLTALTWTLQWSDEFRARPW